MKTKPSAKIFSVTVTGETHQQLKKLAYERDEKMAHLVRRMIKHCLEKKFL